MAHGCLQSSGPCGQLGQVVPCALSPRNSSLARPFGAAAVAGLICCTKVSCCAACGPSRCSGYPNQRPRASCREAKLTTENSPEPLSRPKQSKGTLGAASKQPQGCPKECGALMPTIVLQVGQCGNQLGQSLWQQMAAQGCSEKGSQACDSEFFHALPGLSCLRV